MSASGRCSISASMASLRPAIWELEGNGDTAVAHCPHSDLLVVYCNNHPVALLPGSPTDEASLNSILYGLRMRASQA